MNETQDNFSEKALIEKFKLGDRKAQMELYYRYYKAMYNTSLRILNRPADAEDAMQEAFIKAFRNLNNYEARSSFGHWIKQIVIHTSIDMLRKHRRLVEINQEEEAFAEVESEEPDRLYDENEIAAMVGDIREAILQLPEGYRVIVSLHLLEGYDHEEIGQILGISNSTARSQYARGRKRLLEELKKKKHHE